LLVADARLEGWPDSPSGQGVTSARLAGADSLGSRHSSQPIRDGFFQLDYVSAEITQLAGELLQQFAARGQGVLSSLEEDIVHDALYKTWPKPVSAACRAVTQLN
jgi:hypothetical protein